MKRRGFCLRLVAGSMAAMFVSTAAEHAASGPAVRNVCESLGAEGIDSQRTVVTLDLYHHVTPEKLPPEKKLGIYAGNLGRYTWCDSLEVNGFSALRLQLWRQGYLTRDLEERITAAALRKTEIFLIHNPDSQVYWEKAIPFEEDEIAALVEFVRSGGRLMVMANSSPDSRGSEPYDRESLNRLASHFGIHLNKVDSGDVPIDIPPDNPFFQGLRVLQYGQGCTMTLSKKQGVENETLLRFKNEPIIVLSRLGAGKALFIGDGSSFSNFPLHRMGSDNAAVALQLFELLRPSKSKAAPGRAIKIGSSAAQPEKFSHALRRQVRTIAKFDHPLRANAPLNPRELYRWQGVEDTKTVELRKTSEFDYPWLLDSPLKQGQYRPG
ncbi:MAG: DUF4350 domain-containing protein [Acidimicrobiia bacterium]|nr:DUF4350 domain-containing protein [Acidimicrobiia bacterium]